MYLVCALLLSAKYFNITSRRERHANNLETKKTLVVSKSMSSLLPEFSLATELNATYSMKTKVIQFQIVKNPPKSGEKKERERERKLIFELFYRLHVVDHL